MNRGLQREPYVKQNRSAKHFDPSRLANVAGEPNLTSLGWDGRRSGSATPTRRGWLAVVRASLARVRYR